MGMSIKEAHEIISRPLYMKNTPQEIIDAHRVAIECMRKCYEIEKIIHDSPYCGGATARKIREVIENEIIDNVRGNRATELLEHISALSTKEEVIATLTEIQLEIEEKEQYYQEEFLESKNAIHDAAMSGRMFGCGECKEIIQQKINALKGDQEGEE